MDFSPRLATARAGNVIGGGDWATEDRLVPDLVRAAVSGNSLKIRNPDATRPWQHVLEPLSAWLGQLMLEHEEYADAWNIGPDSADERSVKNLGALLSVSWPNLCIEPDGQNNLHEAAALHLNCDKAKRKLSWSRSGIWKPLLQRLLPGIADFTRRDSSIPLMT